MNLCDFISAPVADEYEDDDDTYNSGDEFSLGSLDITSSEEINFDEIDADLKRFQEDDMVQKSLSRGVDLRQYARETERELRELTNDSIQDYMDQIDEVAVLNDEIDICDKTLERMQQMLQTFQSRLGGISDDIKHLQDDSLSMNIKLKNRRAVEARLQTFLEGIVVPPALVVSVCDSEVNEAYVESLQILNDKLKYASSGEDKPQQLMAHNDTVDALVRSGSGSGSGSGSSGGSSGGSGETKGSGKEDGDGGSSRSGTSTTTSGTLTEMFTLGVAARDTNAAQEVLPLLEMMRSKAVAKVRDFLLARITSLRKGKTNVQMTQQMLLKFRYLNYFLKMHAPTVADEVKTMYESAMSKVLLALFKAYHQQLSKLMAKLDDKKSVFATVPPRSSGGSSGGSSSSSSSSSSGGESKKSSKSSKSNQQPKLSNPVLGVFEIGTRHEILEELDNPPIVMHIAQKESMKYLYEHIFRSVQKHLSDSAANDFTFLVDFFHARSHEMFNNIYTKTLALCLENIEHYLATTMDSIAVLIIIRINQHLRSVMQRRCCPCLDPYLDRVDLLLWPKLKIILDKNVISLKNVSAHKLGPLEFHVHFITQRYAHFSSAVALLHREGAQFGGMTDANFMIKVRELRTNVLDVLKKLSDLHQNEKARTM